MLLIRFSRTSTDQKIVGREIILGEWCGEECGLVVYYDSASDTRSSVNLGIFFLETVRRRKLERGRNYTNLFPDQEGQAIDK